MTRIIITEGRDGKATAEVRGFEQPTAEVVQSLPGAGLLVIKIPGYSAWVARGEQAYQPVSYEVYAIDKVISPTELEMTRLVTFDARATELFVRQAAMLWQHHSPWYRGKNESNRLLREEV